MWNVIHYFLFIPRIVFSITAYLLELFFFLNVNEFFSTTILQEKTACMLNSKLSDFSEGKTSMGWSSFFLLGLCSDLLNPQFSSAHMPKGNRSPRGQTAGSVFTVIPGVGSRGLCVLRFRTDRVW